MAWGLKHPQAAEQSGSDRMREIAEYKVVFTLWSKVSSSRAKLSSMLGRTWLAKVFADIEPAFVQSAVPVSDQVKAAFVRQLKASLEIPGEQTDKDIKELVWAEDFNQVLQQRQEKRKAAAVQRLAEAKEEEKRCVKEAFAESEQAAAAGTEQCQGPDAQDQPQVSEEQEKLPPKSFKGAKVTVEDLGNGNTRTIFDVQTHEGRNEQTSDDQQGA